MIGIIIDCLVRYLDEPTEPRANDEVAYLELVSACLFIPTSVIYILADIVRFIDYDEIVRNNNNDSDGDDSDVENGNGPPLDNSTKRHPQPNRSDSFDA